MILGIYPIFIIFNGTQLFSVCFFLELEGMQWSKEQQFGFIE